MYRRKLHSSSEMRYLVNRTAIHVLSQNHRIRGKMLPACTSRGATCTVKQGRIVQTQNFIFGRISNFFLLSKWDLDPPTHPHPNYFWIFGIFLTLQSPLPRFVVNSFVFSRKSNGQVVWLLKTNYFAGLVGPTKQETFYCEAHIKLA